MNIGMLWLDADSRRPFEEKVQRAADYYQEKYGRLPNMCMVNTKTSIPTAHVGRIEIKTAQNILPHHFWLGVKV